MNDSTKNPSKKEVKDHANKSAVPELERIKKEIIDGTKKDKNKIQWGSAAITLVLVGVLLFSGVQAVQSVAVFNKVKTFKATAPNTAAGASSLESLPDMVGGC